MLILPPPSPLLYSARASVPLGLVDSVRRRLHAIELRGQPTTAYSACMQMLIRWLGVGSRK